MYLTLNLLSPPTPPAHRMGGKRVRYLLCGDIGNGGPTKVTMPVCKRRKLLTSSLGSQNSRFSNECPGMLACDLLFLVAPQSLSPTSNRNGRGLFFSLDLLMGAP